MFARLEDIKHASRCVKLAHFHRKHLILVSFFHAGGVHGKKQTEGTITNALSPLGLIYFVCMRVCDLKISIKTRQHILITHTLVVISPPNYPSQSFATLNWLMFFPVVTLEAPAPSRLEQRAHCFELITNLWAKQTPEAEPDNSSTKSSFPKAHFPTPRAHIRKQLGWPLQMPPQNINPK